MCFFLAFKLSIHFFHLVFVLVQWKNILFRWIVQSKVYSMWLNSGCFWFQSSNFRGCFYQSLDFQVRAHTSHLFDFVWNSLNPVPWFFEEKTITARHIKIAITQTQDSIMTIFIVRERLSWSEFFAKFLQSLIVKQVAGIIIAMNSNMNKNMLNFPERANEDSAVIVKMRPIIENVEEKHVLRHRMMLNPEFWGVNFKISQSDKNKLVW